MKKKRTEASRNGLDEEGTEKEWIGSGRNGKGKELLRSERE